MALGPLTVQGSAISVETMPQLAKRQGRRPSHTFQLKYKPYQLVPFMLAPVLPGETMKNALIQARAVSDPVVSPLIGWWNEYFLFYVKLRDIEHSLGTNELTEMLLTNVPPESYIQAGAVAESYHGNIGGYDYSSACMAAVVEEYFRDDDELIDAAAHVGIRSSGTFYRAKVNLSTALQSLALDSDVPGAETEQLLGEGYTLPPHMAGFQTHYDEWVKMRDMTLTEATFDDWLKQHGVRVDPAIREEQHRPELIRYIREWKYPSNSVDPTDGSVASALSWSIAERSDKDRYFAEPGFIFGVTLARPKVYYSKQQTAIGHFLNDAYSWLPALLDQDPFTSLKKFDEAATAGPIKDLAGDYWLDLKDLFLHGDQYIIGSELKSAVTLPDDSAITGNPLNDTYPTDADVTALFVTAGAEYIRCDGRCDLNILSRLRETTR